MSKGEWLIQIATLIGGLIIAFGILKVAYYSERIYWLLLNKL